MKSDILLTIFSSNAEIQKNGIALINALFLKADIPKRKVGLIMHKCPGY